MSELPDWCDYDNAVDWLAFARAKYNRTHDAFPGLLTRESAEGFAHMDQLIAELTQLRERVNELEEENKEVTEEMVNAVIADRAKTSGCGYTPDVAQREKVRIRRDLTAALAATGGAHPEEGAEEDE